MATAIITFYACSSDNNNEPKIVETEIPDGGGEDITEDTDNSDSPDSPESDSKILVAYFSWVGIINAWHRKL